MFSNSGAFVTGLEQQSLATAIVRLAQDEKKRRLTNPGAGMREREGGRECQKVIFSQLLHNAFSIYAASKRSRKTPVETNLYIEL